MKFRVGQGIDMHRYKDGDHIILAGVKVPHTMGIDAHSDGDVVLHSITDALLGALALGDIGQWFPDSDPDLADIDSKALILPIIMSMRDNGYELNNLDVTIIAEAPKIGDYKDEIKQSLLDLFEADKDQINIKATTAEKMGSIGRMEGIEAHAIVSLIGGHTTIEHTSNHFMLMPDELDTSRTDVHEILELDEIELDSEDL